MCFNVVIPSEAIAMNLPHVVAKPSVIDFSSLVRI